MEKILLVLCWAKEARQKEYIWFDSIYIKCEKQAKLFCSVGSQDSRIFRKQRGNTWLCLPGGNSFRYILLTCAFLCVCYTSIKTVKKKSMWLPPLMLRKHLTKSNTLSWLKKLEIEGKFHNNGYLWKNL